MLIAAEPVVVNTGMQVMPAITAVAVSEGASERQVAALSEANWIWVVDGRQHRPENR
jgi:hypothetical protein